MADDDDDNEEEEVSGPPAPIARTGGGRALNRERFRQELQANPQLLAHVINVLAGESQGDGATAVFETMMNRAETLGQTLAQSSRRTLNGGHDGGYYAGYRNILSDPKQTERYMHSVMEGLSGSNYAHGATDNSSQDLAIRDADSGRFTLVANFGGNGKTGAPGVESFFIPGPKQPDYLAKYNNWRQTVGEFPPPTEGKVMAANSYQPNANNMDPETYQRIWREVEAANPKIAQLPPQQRAQVMAQTMTYIAKTMPKQKAIGPYDAEENERKRHREERADARFKASEERAKTRTEEKRAHDKAKELESEWKRAGARLTKATTRLDRLENNRRQLMVNIGNALDEKTKNELRQEMEYYKKEIPKAQAEVEAAEVADKRAEKYFHQGGGSEKDDIRQLEERTRAAYGDPDALKLIDEAAKADHLDFSTSRFLRENPVIEPKENEDRLTPTGEVKGAPRPPANFNNPYAASRGPVDPNRPGDLTRPVAPMAAPMAAPPAKPYQEQTPWERTKGAVSSVGEWASDVGQHVQEDVAGIHGPSDIGRTLRHADKGPSFMEQAADNWIQNYNMAFDSSPKERFDKMSDEEFYKTPYYDRFMAYTAPYLAALGLTPMGTAIQTAGQRAGEQVEHTTGSPGLGAAAEWGTNLFAGPAGARRLIGGAGRLTRDAQAYAGVRPMHGPTGADFPGPRQGPELPPGYNPTDMVAPYGMPGGPPGPPRPVEGPPGPEHGPGFPPVGSERPGAPYGPPAPEHGPPGPEHGPAVPPYRTFVGPEGPMQGPPAPMQGPPRPASSDYINQQSFTWPTYGEMPKGKGAQYGFGDEPGVKRRPLAGSKDLKGVANAYNEFAKTKPKPPKQLSMDLKQPAPPPPPPVRPEMPRGTGDQMGFGDPYGPVGPMFNPQSGHQFGLPFNGASAPRQPMPTPPQQPMPTAPQSPQLSMDFNAPRPPGSVAADALGARPRALPRPSTIYGYPPTPPAGYLPAPAPMWQPPPFHSPQTFNQGQYMIGRYGNPYERVPEMAPTRTPETSATPPRYKVPTEAEQAQIWAAHQERASKPKRKRTTKKKAAPKSE